MNLFPRQIEGASKGGKGKKDAAPAGGTGEIYEKCRPYMDNDTEIPMPLLANLIKHELLEIKTRDMTRRDISRKVSVGYSEKHLYILYIFFYFCIFLYIYI